ncbi:hypothetical protein EFY87_14750 [Flexivirga caeni]|uniref:Uncharacterized protein n=1 Tax=Flexivirga caeni TaxID=2294115 RepID=A0A3M9M4I6_9MICO|nr:hypothetical protein EFY87_14750 [Flexivirga caeni]
MAPVSRIAVARSTSAGNARWCASGVSSRRLSDGVPERYAAASVSGSVRRQAPIATDVNGNSVARPTVPRVVDISAGRDQKRRSSSWESACP